MRYFLSLFFLFLACKDKSSVLEEGVGSPTIKIGMILPLTGMAASFGQARQNGVELAKKKYPNLFKDVEIVYEDSAYDPKKALTAYRKLTDIDNVKVVFCWGTEPNEPLASLIKHDQNILLFAGTAKTSFSSGIGNIIREGPEHRQHAELLRDYLIKKKFKRVVILKDELTFFNGITKELTSLTGDISIDVVDTGDNVDSLGSILTRVKKQNYDAIGAFMVPAGMIKFYNLLNTYQYKIPVFGTDALDDKEVYLKAGNQIKGTVYSTIRTTEAFKKEYLEIYKNDNAIVWAGNAYDLAIILAKVLQKTSSDNTQEILAALPEIFPFQGANGEITYVDSIESGRQIRSEVVLRRIE